MEQLSFFFPGHFIERLSERARSSILRALDLARRERQTTVRPVHLLTVLESQRGALAKQIMQNHRFRSGPAGSVAEMAPASHGFSGAERFSPSPALKTVLRRAAFLAAKFHQPLIGTEHLLAGLIDVAPHDPELNARLGAAISEKMRKHIHELSAASEKLLDLMRLTQHKHATPKTESNEKLPDSLVALRKDLPALEDFGQDLLEAARQGRVDPVIGREKELERITSILVRRAKNNPLLVGDPGVGKTALVMGLASRMAEGRVPPELADKGLYLVDMGLLVAGTTFRGEFEARLKELVEEAKEAAAILFIDEFHTVIGAGSVPGSLDAANLLKPALASGEIQCIGATTYTEYRRYIERDQALERRLQPVFVGEPSSEGTLAILEGLRPRLETHHRLIIPTATLQAAVRLAPLYLPDRFFPDRAIDLLDEAASRVRVANYQASGEPRTHPRPLTASALQEKKFRALEAGEYDLALEIKALADRYQRSTTSETAPVQPLVTLTPKNLREFVAEVVGVPVTELSSEVMENVARIKTVLSKNLIGQREATNKIVSALRRAKSGFGLKHRPLASFLFLGPKGVGKTECARILARALFAPQKSSAGFGSERAGERPFVKLDMAEYREAHTISRLIGAPPGYVGYEEGGLLTERVRRFPQSIVLFDEIERAHPQVAELLLHILEDGVATDSQGRRVKFSETIIILTSNLETQSFSQAGALGFQTNRKKTAAPGVTGIAERALTLLKRRFLPQLLDRLDRIVIFRALGKADIARIVTLQTSQWLRSLREQNIRLKLSRPVLGWLTERAFKPEEGARLVRRVIEERLEEPLALYLDRERLTSADARAPIALSAEVLRNRVVFHTYPVRILTSNRTRAKGEPAAKDDRQKRS